MLSQALDDAENKFGPVCTVRKLRHEQLERELFLAQKNAALKSGARGLQARKELKTAESKVAESASMYALAPAPSSTLEGFELTRK